MVNACNPKHSLSSLIVHSITMASDSILLAHGYEELSNVMQELKEWKLH